MGREVHVVVLILLSIFEVWMCYQVLYRTVLDKKYLRTWQKVLIWVNILGVGTLLGINRSILFFSRLMFFLVVGFSGLCICIIEKKNKIISFDVEVLYFVIIAFLDFFFAFLSMEFFGNNFFSFVYKYSESDLQILLFLVPRISIGILLVKWKVRSKRITDYKFGLTILTIFLVALLQGYHIALGYMALGIRTMRGLVSAISMLGFLFLAGGILFFSYRFQMLKKENEMLCVREEMTKKHVEEIEKLMEQKRIQIHDMKNHLMILNEYGKEKNWKSLLLYLNELTSEMNHGEKLIWTHVPILDMVINQKKDKAEKYGIEFHIEETFIGPLPFTDTELCSLFGNLLDNAIEACLKIEHKKKWIEINFLRKSQMMYISIANSIEKRPLEKKGKLISDKSDKEIHGYGLKSVQKIINKYEGETYYQITEEKFCIKIVFFILL